MGERRSSLRQGVLKLYVNVLLTQQTGMSLSLVLVTSPDSLAKKPLGHIVYMHPAVLQMCNQSQDLFNILQKT